MERARISASAIADNGGTPGLGIDLGGDGVTPNDVGDLDPGPDQRQNFPTLGTVALTPTATSAAGAITTQGGEVTYGHGYAAPGTYAVRARDRQERGGRRLRSDCRHGDA